MLRSIPNSPLYDLGMRKRAKVVRRDLCAGSRKFRQRHCARKIVVRFQNQITHDDVFMRIYYNMHDWMMCSLISQCHLQQHTTLSQNAIVDGERDENRITLKKRFVPVFDYSIELISRMYNCNWFQTNATAWRAWRIHFGNGIKANQSYLSQSLSLSL